MHVVDVVRLAHDPARIVPALQELLDELCGPRRPARGLGGPARPGRNAKAVQEAQLNEAMLDLAVDPDLPGRAEVEAGTSSHSSGRAAQVASLPHSL